MKIGVKKQDFKNRGTNYKKMKINVLKVHLSLMENNVMLFSRETKLW